MTRKTVSEKRKFLDMLQECIDDGSIGFELDTAFSDDYRRFNLELIIKIENEKDCYSYTKLSEIETRRITGE